MLAWDPEGRIGPTKPLPDMVTIVEPKEEAPISAPISDSRVQEMQHTQPASAPQPIDGSPDVPQQY